MRHPLSPLACLITLLALPGFALAASSGPWENGKFKGRIAHSADGNANDEDDWGAFPAAFAIIDAFGQMDRVVHIDYNNILHHNDARFYRNMTESVLGSAPRWGIRPLVMFDCQKDLEGALESIRKAIDESSADNPLYYILAGPMEVPLRGIQRSNPEKRKHVYCISHSVWNDGYSQPEKLHLHRHTKRDIIATGVNWVQVKPGSGLTDSTRHSSTPEQWAKYHWMRDSADKRLGWIYSRLELEERCDVSDATMTWFLLTGDEDANVGKLKALLEEKKRPVPVATRRELRIEAENFRRVENFKPERTPGRIVSHQVSLVLNGGTGRIATVIDQPYAARAGVFDVEIRYLPAKAARSEFRLTVGGAPRGEPWTASDAAGAWQSRTIRGVEIKEGDEIQVTAQGGGAEPARLDYVQFNAAPAGASVAPATRNGGPAAKGAGKKTGSAARPSPSRFTATGPLDDPAALPGQIIVAGGKPGYFKYNGGGPAFLCGPDNPELFLFLGDLNPDGTRSKGQQQQIIDRVAASGANAFHVILWRMNRSNLKNEGDDTHCPFVDHDPAKPLNEAVLAQWEGWIAQFEAAGVVVHVDFYDDATDVEKIGWTLDKDGNLHADERRFIAGIVSRWKRFKNIVWSVGESVNKLPRTRIPHLMKTTELIARTDHHHHPIILSFVAPDTGEKDIGKDFVYPGDFYSDPNVHAITWLHVLAHGDDYEAQREAYLRWSRVGYGRFIMMKNETEKFPRTQPQSRIYQWASVMTGQHSMESGHDVIRRANLLEADGHVARFMEQTDFHAMRPSDSRAAQSTRWVLASPQDSYIAYTYAYEGAMGLKGLRAGNYRLLWLDTVSGRTVVVERASVSGGDVAWQKPAELGNEVALYVRRQ